MFKGSLSLRPTMQKALQTSLLQTSWESKGRLLKALEGLLRAQGRLWRGSLGGFQKASGTKGSIINDFWTIFQKNRKFRGSILEAFYVQKSYFLGLQERIQDEADLEGISASILGRFSKAWEPQK